MNVMSVGKAAKVLGLAPDTLRYYDRIGLVRPAARGPGGRRLYTERDLGRLRFVQRAQAMNYQLSEIKPLLRLREQPGRARKRMRQATAAKLADVEDRLQTLAHLRDELSLLLNLCDGSGDACPILDAMSDSTRKGRVPARKKR